MNLSAASTCAVDPQLLLRLSKPGPRYTSYPTAPEWTPAVNEQTLLEHLARAASEGAASPLSLYFHLPFCQAMCAYCGCNVVIARQPRRADLYIDYLKRELDIVAAQLGQRRKFSQLHFGGGTPTFLSEAQLERLWREITARFAPALDAEIAIEVDPVVTTEGQLSLLRKFGFNRLSLGVQDFTSEVQQYVGRIQSVELTERLYAHARQLGFAGINFDLIYGLPKQKLETWRKTVEKIVEMQPDRIAVFSYAHVPWMKPNQKKFDEKYLPSPLEKFQLFTLARQQFLEAGYVAIGMDHFARPDDELARARLARKLQRNFQGYTVKPASDICAFGITAISEVQGCYAQTVKPLAHYYRALDQGKLAIERGFVLTPEDKLRRTIINQIMCNFSVDLQHVGAAFGVDARDKFATELNLLIEAEQLGLVLREDLRLELTPLGQVLVRNVAMIFDEYLRRAKDRGPTFSKTI